MPARFLASLNGFPLDLEHISSTYRKAIAAYDIPYRNGAKTEDMGEEATGHRFKAYWFNETYQAFFAVREELKKTVLAELVHPEMGVLKGRIQSMSVDWDDRDQTAEVEFEFLEEVIDSTEPPRVISVQAAVEAAFASGQAEQMAAFAADVRTELGPEAGGILAKTLDPDLPLLQQFTGISLQARAYLKKVDALVTTIEATLHDIEQPANSLIATVDYGLTLPGRVVGGLAKAIERYAVLLESTREFPLRFLNALQHNLRGLEDTFAGFLTQLKLSGGQRLALEAAALFDEDESRREALKKQEGTEPWDALGHLIRLESPGPILNVDQVEASLALVRAYLQEAIDLARGPQSLPQMAADLLEHVSRVKMDYERVVHVDVPTVSPLFLICQKNGLPYTAVERVAALNPEFPNPNFMQGQVSLYAG